MIFGRTNEELYATQFIGGGESHLPGDLPEKVTQLWKSLSLPKTVIVIWIPKPPTQ